MTFFSTRSILPIPHFSSALSITLNSWAQVFEILHFRHLFALHFLCTVTLYVSLLLTFIPLLSKAYILLPSYRFVALAADHSVICKHHGLYGASSPISSHDLPSYPSPLQTNKGSKPILGAIPSSPRTPPPPPVTPTAHLIAVVDYCYHTYLVLFSHTSLPLETVSCNTTPLLLVPCHKLSPGPQTNNVAPSDLLCTSPSTLSKQAKHPYRAFPCHETVVVFAESQFTSESSVN